MQLPWRTSARTGLSSGSSVVVATVTGLLLAFVAASAVLCAVSTGNAALSYQVGRSCAQSLAPSVNGLGATPAQAEKVARDVREVAAQQGFPQTLFGAYTRTYHPDLGDIPPPWLRFAYRDDATTNLHAVQGGATTGTWLAQSAASDAHIALGAIGTAVPPVTAIYSDLNEPVSSFWCSEVATVYYNPLAGDGVSSTTAFLPTLEDVAKLNRRLDISARFPVTPPNTLAEARDLAARSDRLAAALRTRLTADGLAPVAVVSQPFAAALAEADRARSNVIAFVLPLTAISLLVGLVGVGAIAAQWCQRRQSVLRLLWARGSSPVSLGAKALLELGGPLLFGAVVGLVVARLALPWYAPVATLDPGTTTWATLVVLGAVAAAAVVLTATASWRTHRMFQAPTAARRIPRVLRVIPFELPVAVAAVISWLRLTAPTPKVGVVTLPLDAFALAFPVLVVVVIAGVAARLGRMLLAWSHRLSVWSLPSVQLAVRRLAAASTAATGVLLVGVLAVGTLAVGNSVNRAEQNALASKSGNLIGATTSVQISTTFGERNPALPSTVDAHATVVGVVDRGVSNMVEVDPKTFANGAWIDPERRADTLDLVGRLGHGAAIAVGGAPTGSVTVPGFTPLHTIGTLPIFPGLPGNVGYVAARSDLTTASEINSFYVWSHDDPDTVLRQLSAAGIEHIAYKTTAMALDALPFYTVAWTFGYIASVGALLAVIAAASLLLAVGARRKQTALSGALATRMGLRPATLIVSHLLEFGAVAGSVLLAGVTVGLVTAAFSVPRLDPAPWLRPVEALPDSVAFVLLAVVAGLAVVAVAGWIAVRGVRTARVGELIRG